MKIKTPKRWYSITSKCWKRTCPGCGKTIVHPGCWSQSQSKRSHEAGKMCPACRGANKKTTPKKRAKPAKVAKTKVVKQTKPTAQTIHPKYIKKVLEKLCEWQNQINDNLTKIEDRIQTIANKTAAPPLKLDEIKSMLGTINASVNTLQKTMANKPKKSLANHPAAKEAIPMTTQETEVCPSTGTF